MLLQPLTNTCYSPNVLAKTYNVLVMPKMEESLFDEVAAVSYCPASIVAKLIFGASLVVFLTACHETRGMHFTSQHDKNVRGKKNNFTHALANVTKANDPDILEL